MMERRRFLASLIAVAVASGSTLPIGLLKVLPRSIADDFRLFPNGDIRYIGDHVKRYTVQEFTHWLMHEMILPDAVDEFFTVLPSPFNIDDHTAERLEHGTIVQDDLTYSGHLEIGELPLYY